MFFIVRCSSIWTEGNGWEIHEIKCTSWGSEFIGGRRISRSVSSSYVHRLKALVCFLPPPVSTLFSLSHVDEYAWPIQFVLLGGRCVYFHLFSSCAQWLQFSMKLTPLHHDRIVLVYPIQRQKPSYLTLCRNFRREAQHVQTMHIPFILAGHHHSKWAEVLAVGEENRTSVSVNLFVTSDVIRNQSFTILI